MSYTMMTRSQTRIAELQKENDALAGILALFVKNFKLNKARIAELEETNELIKSERDEFDERLMKYEKNPNWEFDPDEKSDEDEDKDEDKREVYVSMYTDEYPEDDGGRQLSVKKWQGEVDKSMTPKEIFELAEEDGDWDVEFGAGGALLGDDDDDDYVHKMCSTYLISPADDIFDDMCEKEYDLETHKEVPIGTAEALWSGSFSREQLREALFKED